LFGEGLDAHQDTEQGVVRSLERRYQRVDAINVAARSAEDRKQWEDVMHAAHPSTGGWH